MGREDHEQQGSGRISRIGQEGREAQASSVRQGSDGGDGGEGKDRRDPEFSCLPEQRARRLGDWPGQLRRSLSQVRWRANRDLHGWFTGPEGVNDRLGVSR